jgi:DNA adenine methylase
MTKPILKWVGGKTQIKEIVLEKFPRQIKKYHEPFLGGGSILFGLLELVQSGEIAVNEIYASDCNENLINLYKNIQNNYMDVYNELEKLKDIYNSIKNFHFE